MKEGGGSSNVGLELVKKFRNEIQNLEENKASAEKIFEWIKDGVKTLRDRLNGDKPF